LAKFCHLKSYNCIPSVTLFKAKEILIGSKFVPEDSDKFQTSLRDGVTQSFAK